MLKVLNRWFDRYFHDEEALLLFVFLAVALGIIVTLGAALAPVFTGIILAFLMQGMVGKLKSLGLPHLLAVSLVFLAFLGLISALIFVVMPQVWRQLTSLLNELPGMLSQGQGLLMLLPDLYPELITKEQVRQLIQQAGAELASLGQWILSLSVSSIANLAALLIYLVLVPILVFFFLKDGQAIAYWITTFLPERRAMMTQVWHEMDGQIANYVRGKVVEILLVGVVTYIVFLLLGLNYAALLAILVGLSVVIPFIGAAVVTIPVVLIAFFQWGWTNEFYYLVLAYGIIQMLDGNVLVPLLFSEAVNLHPIAIIVAVLFFGGIWGFWGVFFAIPLATLLKAVVSAWPKALPGYDGPDVNKA